MITFDDLQRLALMTGACSTDQAHPVLCGLHLRSKDGALRAEGTDSYVMVVRDFDVEWSESILVVAKDVAAAAKEYKRRYPGKRRSSAAELDATIGEKSVLLSGPEFSFSLRRIEGEFPNADAVIGTPEEVYEAEVAERAGYKKADLIQHAIARHHRAVAKALDLDFWDTPEDDISRALRKLRKPEILDLLPPLIEPTEGARTPWAGLNSRYFQRLAHTCLEARTDAHAVIVDFYKPLKPVRLSCEGDKSWQGLIMPVRVIRKEAAEPAEEQKAAA